MNKNQMASGSGASTVNPLPSAPPSYEEAVGLQQHGGPASLPPQQPQMMSMPMPGAAPGVLPPYPVAPNPMPMPTQCNYTYFFCLEFNPFMKEFFFNFNYPHI